MISDDKLKEWRVLYQSTPWAGRGLPCDECVGCLDGQAEHVDDCAVHNRNKEIEAAMPALLDEVGRLKAAIELCVKEHNGELRAALLAYQISDLVQRMHDWSETHWCASWLDGLAERIWNGADNDEVAREATRPIVEFGKSIGYWITDEQKAVTLAEWEAR